MTPDASLFTHAVVVAAGSGSRFGQSKAGHAINGRPAVVWALRALVDSGVLLGGVLVVRKEDSDVARGEWLPAGVGDVNAWQVVAGGEHRAESVRRGLEALPAECEFVLIHDAARVAVHPDDVRRVTVEARDGGAAILARRVVDTIKRERDGVVTETLDRSDLWAAETPQAFRVRRLREAMESQEDLRPFTDESSILEARAEVVAIVESQHPNPKLTHLSDLPLIELLLRRS